MDIPEDDWEYFYELEQSAQKYKCRLVKEDGDNEGNDDEAEPTERQNMRKNLNSKRKPTRSVSDVGGMSKSVNMSATQFTGDGAFLTEEFITQFIRDNNDDGSVTFGRFCQNAVCGSLVNTLTNISLGAHFEFSFRRLQLPVQDVQEVPGREP